MGEGVGEGQAEAEGGSERCSALAILYPIRCQVHLTCPLARASNVGKVGSSCPSGMNPFLF
eukprot:36374-Chlamydomonas_euryale.AAC.1